MKPKYRIFLNFFYLTFVFIWQALKMTIFEGIDGKGRIVITLSALIFIINVISSKRFNASLRNYKSLLFPLGIWLIYAILNSLVLFDTTQVPFISFVGVSLFCPFVVVCVIGDLPSTRIKHFLRIFQYVLYVSIVTLFLFSKEDKSGLLGLELFDPNELSLYVSLFIVITSIRFLRKELDTIKYILWISIPTIYLISLGSRMAFGNLIILILGLFVAQTNKFSASTLLKYGFAFVLMISVTMYVVDNTKVGERLKQTTEQYEDINLDNPAEGTVFEYYGDRGIYYVLGWDIFKENPIFGIGLKNFIKHYSQVLHVEYMIQLVELGIIGFIIYIIFNVLILKNLIKKRKQANTNEKPIYMYLCFVFFSILFSASVLFLYSSIAVAAIYGVIVLFLKKKNTKKIILCTN